MGINYDFSQDIPELKEYLAPSVNEPAVVYTPHPKMKDDQWKDKYLNLLEQYNQFFRQKVDSVSALTASVDALREEFQKKFKSGTGNKEK